MVAHLRSGVSGFHGQGAGSWLILGVVGVECSGGPDPPGFWQVLAHKAYIGEESLISAQVARIGCPLPWGCSRPGGSQQHLQRKTGNTDKSSCRRWGSEGRGRGFGEASEWLGVWLQPHQSLSFCETSMGHRPEVMALSQAWQLAKSVWFHAFKPTQGQGQENRDLITCCHIWHFFPVFISF